LQALNRFYKALPVMVLMAVIAPVLRADIRFTEHIIDNDFDANSIFPCDIDNDGDQDVLATGIDGGIALWRNDGGYPVQWTKLAIDEDFYGAITVYAIDIDDDGDLDVLGGSWYNHEIACWRNDGGDPLILTRYYIDQNFRNCHEVYAGDIDGDGDIDIIGASMYDNDIAWWRNDGGNPTIWTKFIICDNCQSVRSANAADIDGDSDLDIIGGCFSSNKVIWLRNDGGDPISWTEFEVTHSFAGAHKVLARDLDNDGDPDIVGAGYQAAQIAWWRNDGGDPIIWTMQIIASHFYGAVMVHTADFDNDNNEDVIGAGDTINDVAWWRNNGDIPISWVRYAIDDNYQGAWPVSAADIDNDGDIDALSGSNVITRLSWWENDLYSEIKDNPKTIPENFMTVENYPNPFNANTTIKFTLGTPAEVVIDIYNILGAKITTLLEDFLPVGNYQVNWNARDLPSGIYFFKVQIGDSAVSNKMMLIK
jgi:hypothetical protein